MAPKKFGRRYPWSEWFGSKQFTLKRGLDFDKTVMIHAMAQMVRNAAARKIFRLKVGVHILDTNSLKVEVLGTLPRTSTGRRYAKGRPVKVVNPRSGNKRSR